MYVTLEDEKNWVSETIKECLNKGYSIMQIKNEKRIALSRILREIEENIELKILTI